ncbi:hypothetical protein LJB42_001161 [Komagataella kurtzmanii]|nr:hypothetical protein LJB42_001161 [Komagataella kurtzmanii]
MSVKQAVLEVINESFEEIPLDESSVGPFGKKYKTIGRLAGRSEPIIDESKVLNNLTKSQQFRVRRKVMNKAIKNQLRQTNSACSKVNDDLSEDEIPDNMIVYNVPMTRSLQCLTSKENLLVFPPTPNEDPTNRPRSIDSSRCNSNRSSLFSLNTNCSELSQIDQEYERVLEGMDPDAKFLTIAFNSSNLMAQNEESTQRNFYLQKMKQQHNYLVGSHKESHVHSQRTLNYKTFTRQLDLPPKSKYEMECHQREYEQILYASAQKEKLLEQQRLKQNEKIIRERKKSLEIWKDYVLPKYEHMIQLPIIRELWWKGIPKSIRRDIWVKQIGNKSSVSNTSQLIEMAKKRLILDDRLFSNIILDIPESEQKSVILICTAFLLYYEEHSFKPVDTKVLAGVVSLLFENIGSMEKTLTAAINLFTRTYPHSITQDLNSDYLQAHYASFERMLFKTNNSLYNHFKIVNLSPSEYLPLLGTTFFTGQLSREVCERLMDIYLFEGETFLLRSTLALFNVINYKLFGTKEEIIEVLGIDCLKNLNKHIFDPKECARRLSTESLIGFRYMDVGSTEEFIAKVRNVLH